MKPDPNMMAKLAMLESQIASMRQGLRGLEEEIPGVGDMLPQKFLHEGGGAGAPGIPKGIIVMWSGVTAPAGWNLCNGSNGTPDLRGRFVVGYDPNHTAPTTLPNNNEPYSNPGDLSTGGTAAGNFGGRTLHGYTENNHNDHVFVDDWRHSHRLSSDGEGGTSGINDRELCVTEPVDGLCPGDVPPIEVPALSADYGESDPVNPSSGANSPPGDSAVESTSPLDEGEFEEIETAKYKYTLRHTGDTTEDTDNRPPYYVLAYIMKA